MKKRKLKKGADTPKINIEKKEEKAKQVPVPPVAPDRPAPMVETHIVCERCEHHKDVRCHRLCENRIKELLPNKKLPFYKFVLVDCLVKTVNEQGKRFAKIVILQAPDKIEMHNDIIMVCDTEPLDKEIEQVKRERQEYENRSQTEMFKKEFGANMGAFEKRIAAIENRRQDLLVRCQDIKFPAKIDKIDDTSFTNMKIEVRIPLKTMNHLNNVWELIPNYKLQLQPY